MMSGSTRRMRRSVECWRELVAAQPGSGRTVAEFCAARGVGQAGFYAWRKRLAGAAAPILGATRVEWEEAPGFAAVRVTAGARPAAKFAAMPYGAAEREAAAAFEVVLPGGTTLRAPAGRAAEALARVAAALRSAGC